MVRLVAQSNAETECEISYQWEQNLESAAATSLLSLVFVEGISGNTLVAIETFFV
jgi:hypothetical protein